jgi:cytidine deaminase|tara:strand:- start:153374 stop:153763 length:390 start_codon:yes stop_codon:yes gene_type:complete
MSLFDAALCAQKNAYAPYSKHPVGAALRSASGKIYAGCNVETAHFIATHAEVSAISAMITAGDTKIAEIAIIGPNDALCTPCGDCRQRIREFCDMDDTLISVYHKDGRLLKQYNMHDLLPDSFGPENLA